MQSFPPGNPGHEDSLPEARRFLISGTLKSGAKATVSLDVDGKVTRLGGMKNVGGKYLQRNRDQGRHTGGNLPDRGAGGRRADHGRVAGTAAAGKHTVLVAGPAVAGRPGRTATMAGGQAGAGPMTMGTARRLDTGRGQIAQGQEKNRADNDGPDKAMKGGGPFHKFILARYERKGKDSPGKPVSW